MVFNFGIFLRREMHDFPSPGRGSCRSASTYCRVVPLPNISWGCSGGHWGCGKWGWLLRGGKWGWSLRVWEVRVVTEGVGSEGGKWGWEVRVVTEGSLRGVKWGWLLRVWEMRVVTERWEVRVVTVGVGSEDSHWGCGKWGWLLRVGSEGDYWGCGNRGWSLRVWEVRVVFEG